jgi:urease accessory protein
MTPDWNTGQSTALLTAFQLADSFFPTGMFAHSQGLEGMVRRGRVASAQDVEAFLRAQITWSLLPADGVALINAHGAARSGDLETVKAIDDLLLAIRLPEELRAASCQTGKRLLAETAAFSTDRLQLEYAACVDEGLAPGNAAVAWGVAGSGLVLPVQLLLPAFCHSYCVGVLGAALRLLRITHGDVQGMLHRAHRLIAERAAAVAGRDWRDMQCFTPELDIASFEHQSQDVRMFAS